ncbi:MAG: 3-deoxy-D-manno-octulosonate 8-phosphate phosphatase [Myxococcales bacterium]|nr:3-deoxy-D-manno-octulosonate 8-phosphate phosphatase [Myxococcales bacterium]
MTTLNPLSSLDPARLARLELLIVDCDGVMTDGRVWLDASGRETKAFSVIDGHGLWMLREDGVRLGMITRDRSGIPAVRARKLQFDIIHTAIDHKGACVRAMLSEQGLDADVVGYMGDDIPDLEAFAEVGLRVAPASARPEVLRAADAVTDASGGHGAVRELCDAVLAARRGA